MITRSKIRKFLVAYYGTNPSWGQNWGLNWDGSQGVVSGMLMATVALLIGEIILFFLTRPALKDNVFSLFILIGGFTIVFFPAYKWLGALLYVLLAIPFRVTFYLWNLIPEGEVELEEENSVEESELPEDFEGDDKPKRYYNLSLYKSNDYYIDDGRDDHALIELGMSNRE